MRDDGQVGADAVTSAGTGVLKSGGMSWTTDRGECLPLPSFADLTGRSRMGTVPFFMHGAQRPFVVYCARR